MVLLRKVRTCWARRDTGQGITISDRHTAAVKSFPRPTNAHEVRRFLGLASYFRKFIAGFAVIARPLHNLLKTSVEFDFDNDCERAFDVLKRKLTAHPILRLYDPSAETELHTDASAQGLGAILLQRQKGGEWSPIAYYSQTTNQAEARYHSFELEMLAIVRAVERFHIYLCGLGFTVVTDCNALVHAVSKASLNPRIARWTLALQNYTFKLTHRPGARMAHVDALSRSVCYIETMPVERELEFRQLQDARIKEIADGLEFAENERFELVDSLVYRSGEDRARFYVPESMVNNIIRIHHDEMAHCGVEKVYQSLCVSYWFPAMRKRIKDYIDGCVTCLLANSAGKQAGGGSSGAGGA